MNSMNKPEATFLRFAWGLCALMLFALTSSAFAAEAVSQPALVESAKWVGIASAVLSILLQIAKTDVMGRIFAKIDTGYQPAVILLFTQVIALLESVATGGEWKTVAIQWLFVGGGAMLIYSVIIKPFTKKK